MKKENTSQRLRYIMDTRGVRQVDILALARPYCEKYGVKLGKNDLSQYVNGKTEPGQEKLTVLGLALDVSEAWLMGYDVPMERNPSPQSPIPPGFEPLPKMDQVPLVGSIACGEPITAEENLEGVVGVPAMWRADFALTCKGNSMEPTIKDRDVVAIRRQPEVENGQIAAVRIDGEATLKKVYIYPDRMELRPINPECEMIVLYGDNINTATIEGLAVGLCRGI